MLDAPLLVPLQQRRAHLLNLKRSWSNNVLVSNARYDSHVMTATTLRQRLSGVGPEANLFTWIPLNLDEDHIDVKTNSPTSTAADTHSSIPSQSPLSRYNLPSATTVDANETLLQDILEGESDLEGCEEVTTVVASGAHPQIIWALPVCYSLCFLMSISHKVLPLASAVQPHQPTEQSQIPELCAFGPFSPSPVVNRFFR